MSRSRLIGPVVGYLSTALAAAFFLGWQVSHRGDFQYNTAIFPLDDADEWRYTACSRLVEHGYALFTEVFSAQPPLLFVSLAAGMRLFGDSITGARWVEVVFGVVALLAAVALSWLLFGPVAAAATGLLLAVSPLFLVYGRAVEAEGPMMAMTTLSLAFCLAWRRYGLEYLAAAAGLALAASILFKLFAVEAIVPALWLFWSSGMDRASRVRGILAFVVCAVIPVAANFVLWSPAAQWDQVVTMHGRAAQAALPGVLSPFQILSDLISTDPGLVLLTLAGMIVLALLAVWEDLVFLLLWIGGTTVMLILFRPLFPHHVVILLPGLAVAAGSAVTVLVEQLRSHRWIAALPLAVAALIYVALAPRLARADRHVLIPGLRPGAGQVAAAIRAHSPAHSMVASDNLEVADRAGRLVPPPLCDLSTVRFRTGYSSPALLIGATKEYRASLVAAAPGGIFSQADGYLPWVRRHFKRAANVDGTVIFVNGSR